MKQVIEEEEEKENRMSQRKEKEEDTAFPRLVLYSGNAKLYGAHTRTHRHARTHTC